MKILITSALITSLLLAPNAFAACSVDSNTLFYCQTKSVGKEITLCDAGKTISYAFGKKGKKPELAISVPRSEASTFQWQGIGRWMSYSVNIPNNGHVYNVFWGVDRLTDEHAIEAGVNVEKNGDVLATIYCQEKGLVSNLEGVDLKSAE